MDSTVIENFSLLEPVMALGSPAICLGDNIVVRKIPPATTSASLDAPSEFIYTVDGDIVMADMNGIY